MAETVDEGARLGPIELVRGAAALTAAKLPIVLGLWLLTAGLIAVPRLVALAVPTGDGAGMRPVTNGEVLAILLSPVLVAWVAAMLLRAILQPPTGKLPGAGAWLYVLVVGGLGLAMALATLIIQGSGMPIRWMGIALSAMGWAATLIGPIFALWPIGLVMGGPASSLEEAMRAMRGAVFGFLGAVFVISVLPWAFTNGLAYLLIRMGVRPGMDTILLGGGITAGLKFVGFLVAAEIFRRRYIYDPKVAEAFD